MVAPMPEPVPRVLIADDDPDVRAVLAAQLDGRFEVVGTAADTDEAIALAADVRPDVAIVDVQMPGGGGLRATREICEATPETAIVALSADESERVVLDMLRAGAVAYVRKGVPADELASLLSEALRAHVKLPAEGR
jgi:DNA-binding NarL/FixJ family response regulator